MMLYTLKSFRAVALVSALTGASVLLLSGAAQAGARFHSVTTSTLCPSAAHRHRLFGLGFGPARRRQLGDDHARPLPSPRLAPAPTRVSRRSRIRRFPGYDPNGGTATASRAGGHGPGKH